MADMVYVTQVRTKLYLGGEQGPNSFSCLRAMHILEEGGLTQVS
jgi:hypothetical protein